MGVGLSGMVSGLDTDSIVKAMVSGQQAKATKVENKITLNKWTKEAWSGLNTKIYSFYTKYASKLRLQTSYMTRSASSSNESIVKATAGSGAAVGTHSLQVKKLASSQYVTGGQLKDANGNKANYNKNTKLAGEKGLGIDAGTIITIKGQVGTEDEEVVKIEVNEKTTINDFLSACKDAGLTASFDTNQQRFFISSSESGVEDKFSITTSALTTEANNMFTSIDNMITKEYMTSDEKKKYEDAINTLRTNTELIKTVLSEDYDPKDKTQKAVKTAIDTVENFAVEHVAETEAIRRAELIEWRDPVDPSASVQTKSIDDVISGLFASIPAKAEDNDTEEIFSFYDTKYSEKSLAELKETATNTIKSRANVAANTAIRSLQLDDEHKKYGDIVLTDLTKEKYDNAVKYLEKNDKGVSTADEEEKKASEAQAEAEAKWMSALAELQTLKDNGASNDEIKAVEDKVEKAEDEVAKAIENSNAIYEKRENAEAIIEAWKNATVPCKDADGNDISLTVEQFYQKEYEKVYKVDDNTTSDVDEGLDTDKRIQAEMKNLILSANQTKYNEKISEIKNDILIGTSDNDSEEFIEYEEFIYGTEDADGNLNLGPMAKLKEDFKNAIDTLKSLPEKKDEPDSSNPDAPVRNALAGMGLAQINGSPVSQDSDGTGMVVVEASDAEFVLDGATMTETSNSFTVNGLTLNLSGTTQSKDDPDKFDTVQITVGKDVDSTYKLVKEALTEYNKLIEEMNTLYNADSARGYDPLTDEQKESMSETDIENWEKKIKDSLLRRDNTLGTLLSSMRNALSTSYTDEDGKTYSLASYGIVTGHYTEKGKLHIYGDEEDATYATYSDRLKAALEEDPDKVMETLTHVFGNLYSTMTEKCAKTEISSALTFYNDKQYNNLLKDYEDDLDILQDRIKELEDRYYKQFTAMEKAMSVLQNQSNSLASLLGTGQ